MKIIFFFITSAFLLLTSCNNIDSKAAKLIVNNITEIDNSIFKTIECCGENGYLSKALCNSEFNRVKKIHTNNSKINNKIGHLLLTLKPFNDSVFFNIEHYEVNQKDTLRIANYGGKTISRVDAESYIKETICGFVNK